MGALGSLLGWRDFSSREEIAEHIVHSVNFDSKSETPSAARTLLLFQTSKQRTWLVATPQRLYCILDDVRKPEPHINWSMPKSRIIADGDVVLDMTSHGRTEKTGLVDFGKEHRRWLYTHDLFDHGDVVTAIRDFLKETMR